MLSIIPYDGEEDAIRIANDSDYGLGGSVWTRRRPWHRCRTTDSDGTIGVNQYLPDPAAPFGGVKGSGLGRELGPEGLVAYQQLQSIYPAAPSGG